MLLNGLLLCGIMNTWDKTKGGAQTDPQNEQKALQNLCRMTKFQKPIDKGFWM